MPVWTSKADFKPPKLRTKLVDVPEWGEDVQVYIRELSAYARDQWESQMQEKKFENARAVLICKCIVDDAGKRIYADRDAAEFGKSWPASGIDRLYDECRKLIQSTPAEVKELEKNSPAPTGANGSSSSSPLPLVSGTLTDS